MVVNVSFSHEWDGIYKKILSSVYNPNEITIIDRGSKSKTKQNEKPSVIFLFEILVYDLFVENAFENIVTKYLHMSVSYSKIDLT